MQLSINGEKKLIEKDHLTITELLKIQEVKMPEMVTVEHNGDILDRASFDTTSVNDGDEIEFLYFMGGGQ
jgi:sulfur carrier protein